jgi:hypothetical protein
MTKSTVQSWDATSSNNSDIAGINIAESCPAAGINDAIRNIMAQVATWITDVAGPLLKSGGAMTGNVTSMGNGSTVMDGAATPVQRNIGYRSLPTSRSVSTAATVTLADEGMVIKSTAGGLTVPANATLAIPVDFLGSFYNNSGSAQTITAASGVTFQIEGNASTQSSVSVPKFTRAFFWQSAANNWVVSGKAVA